MAHAFQRWPKKGSAPGLVGTPWSLQKDRGSMKIRLLEKKRITPKPPKDCYSQTVSEQYSGNGQQKHVDSMETEIY